jgi:hypothetical protein
VRILSSYQAVPYFGLPYHFVSARRFECLEKAGSAAQFLSLFEATLTIYSIVGGKLRGF